MMKLVWKPAATCLKTIETCSNMVMFIPVPLYTMVMFDDWKNGCLVTYIITSWNKQNDLSKWVDFINQKMQESKPDRKSNAFVVDVKINSLRWQLKCFNFL
jgi:hypothetical protein